MLVKRGVNNTRREKHVRGVAPTQTPDKEASTLTSGVTKTVSCQGCGSSFKKQCAEGYLCDVMNTKCPNCGGTLR